MKSLRRRTNCPSPWRVAGITSRKRNIAFILVHRGNKPDYTLSRFAPEDKCRKRVRSADLFIDPCRSNWRLRQVPSSEQASGHRLSRSCLARFASKLAHSPSAFRAASNMLDSMQTSNAKSYAVQTATSPLAPFGIKRREPGSKDVEIAILFCGVC